MKSKYDIIRPIYLKYKNIWQASRIFATILLTITFFATYTKYSKDVLLLLIVSPMSILLFYYLTIFLKFIPLANKLYSNYTKYQQQVDSIEQEVKKLYDSVNNRKKGSLFKKHYNLTEKSINDFEKILSIATWKEQKEIYVTALCKNDIVAKVYATIGSKYKCRPSFNVRKIVDIAESIRCEEVREYHNHLVCENIAKPSDKDILSLKTMNSFFSGSKIKYRCFIIYWNQILEYRVIEYNEERECFLVNCLNSINEI
jgi:ribosomal protein L20A (L18A)